MLHGNGMIVMDWQRRRTWTIQRLHDTTLHFFRKVNVSFDCLCKLNILNMLQPSLFRLRKS